MVRSLKNAKKGAYYFVVDSILGILIFATTIFILSSFNSLTVSSDAITQQVDLVTTDLYETQLKSIDITDDFFLKLKKNPAYTPFLTVDEFAYALYLQNTTHHLNATYLIGNLTSWVVPSYGLNYSIDTGTKNVTIFYRNSAITSYEDSRSSLTREKLTLLVSNITNIVPPAFSMVVMWR